MDVGTGISGFGSHVVVTNATDSRPSPHTNNQQPGGLLLPSSPERAAPHPALGERSTCWNSLGDLEANQKASTHRHPSARHQRLSHVANSSCMSYLWKHVHAPAACCQTSPISYWRKVSLSPCFPHVSIRQVHRNLTILFNIIYRPYKCKECGDQFARRFVVNQHCVLLQYIPKVLTHPRL